MMVILCECRQPFLPTKAPVNHRTVAKAKKHLTLKL